MEVKGDKKRIESVNGNEYQILKTIGEGGFCVVMRGTNVKTKEVVAIKKTDSTKKAYKKYIGTGGSAKVHAVILKEANIMQSLEHPNLMKLIELIDGGQTLYLILEYAEGGDLFNRVLNQGKFPEEAARIIIKQIISGIKFMHAKGYVHRDVKAENILFQNKKSNLKILVTDFGLSRLKEDLMYTNCGTIVYSAPELLMNKTTKDGYTYKVDNWGIGVLTYFTMSGKLPFNAFNKDELETKRLILTGKYEFSKTSWMTISDSAKQFIARLLEQDPKRRMELEDAENHFWISKMYYPPETQIEVFPMMEKKLKSTLANIRWRVLIDITISIVIACKWIQDQSCDSKD